MYSDPSQRSMMKLFFAKNSSWKPLAVFAKKLHLRSLNGFWMHHCWFYKDYLIEHWHVYMKICQITRLNERYTHANWKSTDKLSLTCFKSVLKISHPNYLEFYSNLPVKHAISLKSSLLFNIFYCLFSFKTKLYSSITLKLEQLWMRKLHCLLFLLKQSYICYNLYDRTLKSY